MKLFKIEENDANSRLDKFLKKLFPNATRSLIYKINRKDKIKIKSNDTDWKFKKKDNEYKLKIWDEIKIFLSEDEFLDLSKNQQKEELPKWKNLSKEDIVYEDWELLIINKNAWINVHPWDHKTKEISLIEQVQDYLGNNYNSLTFKPSLAHRIDRDTSWIVIVAKKKNILQKLVSDFKKHDKIKKTYYTLVFWKLSRKTWTIKKKLERIENAINENKVKISDSGQEAITHYKLLGEYVLKTNKQEIIISELEVNIETWRMHQIRVHLTSIWNPIIWDKIYWDKVLNSYIKNNFSFDRQALHASEIEFFHYWRDKKIKLNARLKEDIKIFLNKIKNQGN